MIRSSKLILGAALALGLAACNAVLGIDKNAKVKEHSPAVCPAGNCPESCKKDEDCPETQECLSGSCHAMDGGNQSDLDAELDGGDLDGEVDGSPRHCTTLACLEPAVCVADSEGEHCECGGGYQTDGQSGCVDIDECKEANRGGCSVNATCNNQEGGRTCTCDPEFADVNGDGTQCVDKCSPAASGCDAQASCTVVSGNVLCQCTGNYTGDGKSCTYNASCVDLACSATTSQCVLKAQSTTEYECKCLAGFELVGGACVDIDECTRTPTTCGANADCRNTAGSHSCICQAGFAAGAGGLCENIPDCVASTGGPSCLNGGVCTDLVSSYSCNCAGTGFSGPRCQTNDNDCPSNACTPGGACQDAIKSYSCVCNVAGYVSIGTSCQDVDDCAPNPCTNGGRCSDRVNDFACDCTGTGWIGKRCEVRSQGCSAVGTACSVGVGECVNTGVWVCDAAGTAASCSVGPKPSTAEICDGKDNNCDTRIDEGFNVGADCNNALLGECRRTGKIVCSAGAGACNAPSAQAGAEVCDNKDNDCNGVVDNNVAKSCSGQNLMECVTGVTTPRSCSATNTTCNVNACVGACIAGNLQCDQASGNSFICDGTGTPRLQTPCTAPDSICSRSTGRCVDNFKFPIGRSSATGGSSAQYATRDVIATSIMVTEDVKLREIGVLTASNSVGGQALVFLYADVVTNGKHRPGSLITFATAQSLFTGGNTWTPRNTDVSLQAGRLYWIATTVNVAAGQDVRLYEYDAVAGTDGTGVVEFTSVAWGTVPDPFPAAASTSRLENASASLYLQVQRYWH